MNDIIMSSSYRVVNTLNLGYKIHPVSAVYGNNHCFFSEIHTRHKNTHCSHNVEFCMLYLVVGEVTTRF
jgi:hypothetical protein